MAEEALRNNRSTEPVLLSHLFDSEPDWNSMEFLIKWKGQSHLHCQWKSISELQNVCFVIFLLVYAYALDWDNLLHVSLSNLTGAVTLPFSFILLWSVVQDAQYAFAFVTLQLSGFKKVLNYTKKVMEDAKYRKTISREEVFFLFPFLYIYFRVSFSSNCI